MIFPNLRVPASGPRNARLATIGMAPAKNEIADKTPFTGPSGRIFNEALATSKVNRSQVFVSNLCNFFIDDNNLYSVPEEIMENERQRVFRELDEVKPNCLLIMGADTLDLLTASHLDTAINKKTGEKYLVTINSKEGIIKWRGSIFELKLPSGRVQKCVAAMHPASFIRGQWKWLPLFKYIDVPRAVTQSSFPEMRLMSREAIVGPSFQQAIEYLQEAETKEWISIDYEGMVHITCLGIGWTATQALCIPLNRVGAASYWSVDQEIQLWKLWCQILQNPKVKIIAQNASYEWIKSWLHGIYPNPLGIDTMHAHHCLYPDWGGITDEWTKRKRDIDNPGHGLALITSQYTDQPFYKDEGRHWRPEHGERAFWQYNALDVMVTYEAAFKMMEELKSLELWEVYQREYLDGFEHLLRMEWFGTKIDVDRRASAQVELTAEMHQLCVQLEDLWKLKVITKSEKKGQKPQDGLLNLASPAQVKTFFLKQGYKLGINRKTGQPKLAKEDLQALAIKHDSEAIRTMLRVREIQDLINDVLTQPLDPNHNIHSHWRLGGTNVTRLSSGESILGGGTNLQNLPRQGVARSLFLP